MCFRSGYPLRLGIVTNELENGQFKMESLWKYIIQPRARADKPLDWFATRQLGQKPSARGEQMTINRFWKGSSNNLFPAKNNKMLLKILFKYLNKIFAAE